jgi:hypothetical protein
MLHLYDTAAALLLCVHSFPYRSFTYMRGLSCQPQHGSSAGTQLQGGCHLSGSTARSTCHGVCLAMEMAQLQHLHLHNDMLLRSVPTQLCDCVRPPCTPAGYPTHTGSVQALPSP